MEHCITPKRKCFKKEYSYLFDYIYPGLIPFLRTFVVTLFHRDFMNLYHYVYNVNFLGNKQTNSGKKN